MTSPDDSPTPPIAPWVRRAMSERPLPVRGEVRRGALIAGALALLGAPAGLVWSYAVPEVAVQKLGSPAYLLPVRTEDLASMGGDLVLIAILLSIGVVSALAVVGWSRRAQVGPLIGLLVGGALCGVIAMAVGHLLVEGDYHAVFGHPEDGRVFQIRPYVRGSADFLVLPLFAALVFLIAQLPGLLKARKDVRPLMPPAYSGDISSGAAVTEADAAPGQIPSPGEDSSRSGAG